MDMAFEIKTQSVTASQYKKMVSSFVSQGPLFRNCNNLIIQKEGGISDPVRIYIRQNDADCYMTWRSKLAHCSRQCCGAENISFGSGSTKTSSATMIFPIKFLRVCGKQKGVGATAAIRNFGSGSGRQLNFGSSALGSGSATLAPG